MKTFLLCMLALIITSAAVVYSLRWHISNEAEKAGIHIASSTVDRDRISSYPDDDRQYILDAVNIERRHHDAKPLSINTRLNEAAKRKAEAMIEQGFFSHTDPDGADFSTYITAAGYDYQHVGENLAENYPAAGAMNAWIASPSHFKNIINPDYEEIGIWIEWPYIVQMFGVRQELKK